MTRVSRFVTSRSISRLGAVAVLAAAILDATRPAAAGADPPKLEDTPKLSVRGEAELSKPADRLIVNMGVVNDADEAAPALKVNSERMDAVIRAIERLGLTEDEYETGRFRVRPNYSRRPRQADADWQPQIIGYQVTNTVTIRTKKLELAGAIIEAGNKAGANQIEVAGFDISDPRRYRGEAIRIATTNARQDARELADAAGVELIRIISINLDYSPIRVQDNGYQAVRAMADAGAAPPISAGDVTIRAGVTIVYEIAPAPPR